MRFSSLTGCIISLLLLFSAHFASAQTHADEPRFQTLYQYARLAGAAYASEQRLRQAVSSAGFELTAYDTLPGYGVSYFVLTNPDQRKHIIVVRGTSNIENVMVDAAFKLLRDKQTGVKLHQGFAVSANYLYERIQPKLHRDYTIDATGHSLGGAVALILAMHLDADRYAVGEVITFGQPKVTTVAGGKRFAHLDVTRVVMEKDPVPLTPPFDPMELMNLDIYWHLGKEVVLLPGNAYAELEGMDSMMRAVDFFQTLPGADHVRDHYMDTYLAALKARLNSARRVEYESGFNPGSLFGLGNKSAP